MAAMGMVAMAMVVRFPIFSFSIFSFSIFGFSVFSFQFSVCQLFSKMKRWLAGWLANVSKRFIFVREGQRQRARQPSQATPPPYHPRRPNPGVGDSSAPIHQNAIFTLPFFAFFARFLTQSLSVFASAHGRIKYPLFRTVRPFSHPLATKARRRQRQNPFRNCALFRV